MFIMKFSKFLLKLAEDLKYETSGGTGDIYTHPEEPGVYTKIQTPAYEMIGIPLESDLETAYELYKFLSEQGSEFYEKVPIARIYDVRKIGKKLEIKMEGVKPYPEYVNDLEKGRLKLPRTLIYRNKDSRISTLIPDSSSEKDIELAVRKFVNKVMLKGMGELTKLPQEYTLDSGKTISAIKLGDRHYDNLAFRINYPEKGTDSLVHIDLDSGSLRKDPSIWTEEDDDLAKSLGIN